MRDEKQDRGTFEKLGETVGGLAGQVAGRATDATMDVVGSVFGTAANALGDWWSTPSAREAGRAFGEPQERAAREHFEREGRGGSTGHDYDTVRPLYQLGHLAAHGPDSHGRSFREVEPELERAWGEEQVARYGAWPQVRGYVGRGFDLRSEVLDETREAGMRAQGGGSADEREIRSDARGMPEP
jgi:hypothetical protein